MRKVKFAFISFAIVLALSVISNYNLSKERGDNDAILEIRDKTNLRNAGPDNINITTPENKTFIL